MSMIERDVAILMPSTKPEEYDRVAARYAGLVGALSDLGVSSFVTYQVSSYDEESRTFIKPVYEITPGSSDGIVKPVHRLAADAGRAQVVRDVTMQKSYDQPFYQGNDKQADDPNNSAKLTIINNHRVSRLLKAKLPLELSVPDFEQVLDAATAPELVTATKTRLISVGGKIIAAAEYHELSDVQKVERQDADPKALSKDYQHFIDPTELAEEQQAVADGVHAEILKQTNTIDTILAFDVVTGVATDGQLHKTWNMLRKPLRISAWDKQFYALPEQQECLAAVTELSSRWDLAEARLLAAQVADRT